jgi:hypothetical protein
MRKSPRFDSTQFVAAVVIGLVLTFLLGGLLGTKPLDGAPSDFPSERQGGCDQGAALPPCSHGLDRSLGCRIKRCL